MSVVRTCADQWRPSKSQEAGIARIKSQADDQLCMTTGSWRPGIGNKGGEIVTKDEIIGTRKEHGTVTNEQDETEQQ